MLRQGMFLVFSLPLGRGEAKLRRASPKLALAEAAMICGPISSFVPSNRDEIA
jgi:hypothetical protein